MRISDWSSDVCSSDLSTPQAPAHCPPRQSPASRARARAAGGRRSARWGGHRPGQYAVSTSNTPPGISDNPTIEAQSPLWRRPTVIWLLLYPLAALGLFAISGTILCFTAGPCMGPATQTVEGGASGNDRG